jgi:hypothetical protein
MKIRLYVTALIITALTGCTKEDLLKSLSKETKVGEEQTYFIKKGNHGAEGNNMEFFDRNAVSKVVVFDSSAIYHAAAGANQEDVNKLFGFSDCNTHHQENSARIGWSWNGKAVVLYAYAYVNKERIIKMLATVSINEPVRCSVRAAGDRYYFSVNDHSDSLPRHCTDYQGSRYRLYPYFGGDETAPHNITIKMKELSAS